MRISIELKRKCVESELNSRQIYENIFRPEHPAMSYETFRAKLKKWRKQSIPTEDHLDLGTFPGFNAHSATVQLDSSGDITQVWVKQSKNISYDDVIEAIQENITPVEVVPEQKTGSNMLEIPLFDLHFGVASMQDYLEILEEIVGIIENGYDEIHIIIGQDVLHNNDMRGHTAKGTPIEKVDFKKAWNDAWRFFYNIIRYSLENSSTVSCHYSRGNHDECTAWCFFKALEQAFPQARFDDDMAPRKIIWWEGCFIGFGHCEYTQNPDKLLRDFTLEFPMDFATATCREIHTGHFHRESVDDGIMVRRLASAVPTDEWSSNNGFMGVHKRFQLFEYAPCRLRSIYYV